MGVVCLCIILSLVAHYSNAKNDILAKIIAYRQKHGGEGHRCGVCPTYYEKTCAIDENTGRVFLFDNHCVMDLYNCIHQTKFVTARYDSCIHFGNFAYVHGYKFEDEDYGEEFIHLNGAKKNHDFFLE